MSDDTPFAAVKFVKESDGKGFDLAPTVESAEVEDHDRAIDRARVVFDDAEAKIAPILREQVRVQISMGWTSEKAMIFEGIVMSHKTEALGGGQQRVTMTAYDLSYLMKQGQPKILTFSSGTLSEALKAIVGNYAKDGITLGKDNGKSNVVINPDPAFTTLVPLTKMQSQTDWDFIQKLARDYQSRAFVEVNNEQSQFYFVSETSLLKGDPMGTLHYCPGGGGAKLIEFKYERVGSGATPASTVTVIDPKTGDPVTQKADPPPPEPPLQVEPDADAETAQAAQITAASKPEDSRPKPVIAGEPSDPEKAARRTKQDPTRLLGFSGRGTAVGTVKLRAKGKVTIEGIAPWAEGDWYVHKVNHIFTRIIVKDKNLKNQDRSTYQTKFSATR